MPLAASMEVLSNPLFWAVFIGWILSVVLHEFAHGLVAHLGGDYTIRERGGLTLNPLQYVSPFGSIILPLIFLMMGGVPLPGGVTYVRRDLLRSATWDAAVSLAGPVMNVLLFFLCALSMHPAVGLVPIPVPGGAPMTGPFMVISTLMWLQLIAVFLNLIPIPPLDGFQAVAAYMSPATRARLMTPQTSLFGILILFFVVLRVPGIWQGIHTVNARILNALGFDDVAIYHFGQAFNSVLFGR